ncbi:hypothetical protein LJM46_004909 [Escherichia coli]|nr:hypothetical protein [Escherichia coli]
MPEKMNKITFRVTDLHARRVITDEYTAEFGLRLGCVISGEITDEHERGRPCLFVVKVFDFNYDFADEELDVYCPLWRCRSVVNAGDVLDAVPCRQMILPDGRVAYEVRDGGLRYNDDAIIQSWY